MNGSNLHYKVVEYIKKYHPKGTGTVLQNKYKILILNHYGEPEIDYYTKDNKMQIL